MTIQDWFLLGALGIQVIGGIFYFEQRMGRFLTRDEHERICQRARDATTEKLDAILHKVDEVSSNLSKIVPTVAILSDRAGIHR